MPISDFTSPAFFHDTVIAMLSRVGRLFSAEMTKAWYTKLPYLGVACSALMALIAKQSVESFAQPGEITASSYFSASINLSSTLTTWVFSTIFASMLVASETSRGTFRTLLIRPVSRIEFLSAKLLSGIAYMLLLFATNAGVSLAIARGYPLAGAFDSRIEIPGAAEQIGTYSIALLLSLLPQIAAVCFGFVVSVLSANVGTAVGVSLGLLLSLQTAKQFIRIGEFELNRWVFNTYYDEAMRIASIKASGMYEVWLQDKVFFLIGTSLVSAAVFVTIGFWSFLRRDLNV
jgi:ABC-type transport system involved in multi-copper enzyme maturation permease subunit